jgi:hypothetical protein
MVLIGVRRNPSEVGPPIDAMRAVERPGVASSLAPTHQA